MCDEDALVCSAVPGNDGAPCDDFNVCTTDTTCAAGGCGGGTPVNDGLACDDGNSCTERTICVAGACTGGSGPILYFSEDFSDNSAGWTLGLEWAIGPAQGSFGADLYGDDPGFDHSPTADNGVAGVVLGGMATQALHELHYLESPTFDTSADPGEVVLSFYRWLNSDYAPYMLNTIDVWDGVTWNSVWTSGDIEIIDNPVGGGLGWTYVEHTLTPYKNAAMRIRFGLEVGMPGAYHIGSWNIDDVLVAAKGCP